MSAYDPKRTSPSSSTPGLSRYNAVSSGLEGAMRRRDFITLIGTAAAARPVAAHAQQRTMPVVDVLSPATSEADANRMNAIRGGLKDASYIEGENVMIEYRSAENQPGSPKN